MIIIIDFEKRQARSANRDRNCDTTSIRKPEQAQFAESEQRMMRTIDSFCRKKGIIRLFRKCRRIKPVMDFRNVERTKIGYGFLNHSRSENRKPKKKKKETFPLLRN